MIEFRDAKRADTRLLILLAGGTASGKTESAMRLATGLAAGKPFAVIDTENGRALHKADDYHFKHGNLTEPFTPERYEEAIKAADAEGFPVIVIDSGSHEYEGIGGILDIQIDEFARMGERESARMASWIEPKRRNKRYVQQLLRSRAHIILCLRAEDKVEIVKQDGKTVVRPKASLVGADGWIPICEKRLPFESTISLLLLQSQPGVPVPIKLERRHRELVALDAQLDEATGRRLGEWARGVLPPGEGETDGGRLSSSDGNTESEGSGGEPATPRGTTLPRSAATAEAVGVQHQPSPPDAPLTPAGLSRALKDRFVSPTEGKAALNRLFPGVKNSGDLTDEERGQLWAELSKPKQETMI